MKKLTLQGRRILLLLHIIFAAIMLGMQAVFIILALTASVTSDSTVLHACYSIMNLLASSSVRASTIGVTVTGIMLSVMTSWKLFRYNWIIAKEVLTLVCIGVGIFGLYEWTLKGIEPTAQAGLGAWQTSGFTVNHTLLWIGIAAQTVSLIVMYMLSIWKPGGERRPYRKPLKEVKQT
ncbi:hypothetical protein [Paenibacillus lignilyticus]|uniref:DUF2269 domain-containing protein n=1 Tax=Paenibacillus lignilyticus TaxID=1172615 RepID=A0ABS5CHG5_9BACL|nr:hypothetical protein [Paenibacillus lignilyticus]MBP3965323.1 hypothetical protein [Paenibacillus lignilyticus]